MKHIKIDYAELKTKLHSDTDESLKYLIETAESMLNCRDYCKPQERYFYHTFNKLAKRELKRRGV